MLFSMLLQEFVNRREDAEQHLPLHHAVLYGTLPMVKALGKNFPRFVTFLLYN